LRGEAIASDVAVQSPQISLRYSCHTDRRTDQAGTDGQLTVAQPRSA